MVAMPRLRRRRHEPPGENHVSGLDTSPSLTRRTSAKDATEAMLAERKTEVGAIACRCATEGAPHLGKQSINRNITNCTANFGGINVGERQASANELQSNLTRLHAELNMQTSKLNGFSSCALAGCSGNCRSVRIKTKVDVMPKPKTPNSDSKFSETTLNDGKTLPIDSTGVCYRVAMNVQWIKLE